MNMTGVSIPMPTGPYHIGGNCTVGTTTIPFSTATIIPFREQYGDIWQLYNLNNFIVITTNGFVKKNGEAVMGAGIAYQARNRFSGLAYALGKSISVNGNVPLINVHYRIITLPTKDHWINESNLLLIEDGLKIIIQIVNELDIKEVCMPRPGCGNGMKDWESEVKPICKKLLDNRFIICNR
jgi:hypothetical protein